MSSTTIAKRQKTAIAQMKNGRSITLPVAIITTVNRIQVIACTCRTIENDSKQPSLSLAQLTLSQLVRQFIMNPHSNPTTSGKYIVYVLMKQLTIVIAEVTRISTIPALPTSITQYLSAINALSMAPKIHPTPQIISRNPTFKLVRMSELIRLLKQMLIKPLMIPSKTIGINMQYILGQYLIVFRNIDFIWLHKGSLVLSLFRLESRGYNDWDSLKRESTGLPLYKLSRNTVQTSQETKARPAKIIKQV